MNISTSRKGMIKIQKFLKIQKMLPIVMRKKIRRLHEKKKETKKINMMEFKILRDAEHEQQHHCNSCGNKFREKRNEGLRYMQNVILPREIISCLLLYSFHIPALLYGTLPIHSPKRTPKVVCTLVEGEPNAPLCNQWYTTKVTKLTWYFGNNRKSSRNLLPCDI